MANAVEKERIEHQSKCDQVYKVWLVAIQREEMVGLHWKDDTLTSELKRDKGTSHADSWEQKLSGSGRGQ